MFLYFHFAPYPAHFNRVQGVSPLQASTPVSASAENGSASDCGAHNPVLVNERLHHLW